MLLILQFIIESKTQHFPVVTLIAFELSVQSSDEFEDIALMLTADKHVNTTLQFNWRRRVQLQLSHVNLIHSAARPNAMSCKISLNAHSANLNFFNKTSCLY